MGLDVAMIKQNKLTPILHVAQNLGLNESQIELYGTYKSKVDVPLDKSKIAKSNLILVTSITPNKAGVGKTTTSIALAMALTKLGKRATLALREPSLGPCFGMKGGATGGGLSQVFPTDDINLHFTGDFHAITSANNMLAALVDNYQYFNKDSPKALKTILWKRALDVNDRSLRFIQTGLNGPTNGVLRETGFDITAASEMMAIFCLAKDFDDLRERLNNILLGWTNEDKPFYVRDLGAVGALLVLLKDAFKTNLVQTTEGTPAFIHGGPFANIAHGCNSLIATQTAMQLGDYVVTEAGFGSDLGAEKFFNIKCRTAGIASKLSVLVATLQSLKLHGSVDAGLKNLGRHIDILQSFGQAVIVVLNKFSSDSEAEISHVKYWCEQQGVAFELNEGFMKGSDGAIGLAQKVLDTIHSKPSKPLQYTYDLMDSIEEKLNKLVVKIYKGKGVVFSKQAQEQLKKLYELGAGQYPICIAKTQYSFTDDPTQIGDVEGFTIHVENLILNNGARFIVAVAGNLIRMPGLPKIPRAMEMDVKEGEIVGLS
jgi:formate--tetrahydrofolate ligase